MTTARMFLFNAAASSNFNSEPRLQSNLCLVPDQLYNKLATRIARGLAERLYH